MAGINLFEIHCKQLFTYGTFTIHDNGIGVECLFANCWGFDISDHKSERDLSRPLETSRRVSDKHQRSKMKKKIKKSKNQNAEILK